MLFALIKYMISEISITISNCMEVRFAGPDHEPEVMEKFDDNNILIRIIRNGLSELIECGMKFALEQPNGLRANGIISKVQHQNGFVLTWCQMEPKSISTLKEV